MKEETLRKCIATGQLKAKEDLLRFVKTPDSRLVPDFNKKIPGRGLYVSNSRQALAKALKGNLFIKSVHAHLKIEENFLELVQNLLAQKGLQSINLAIKAGAVVTGFEKVKDKLGKDRVAFLVQAVDAAEDGSRKIENAAGDLPVFRLYSTAELDKALDRVNTVHLAVLKSPLEAMVYQNLKRYQDFLD